MRAAAHVFAAVELDRAVSASVLKCLDGQWASKVKRLGYMSETPLSAWDVP